MWHIISAYMQGQTTGLSSEPTRWSCDNCQRMSDFDSCQSNRTHTDGLHNWKASQVVQDLLWHLTSAYIKCVYGWAYATSQPNFLVWIVYQNLLPTVLRCACFVRVRAPLLMSVSLLFKHNRFTLPCQWSNLSPVFGPCIKRKIGIREGIT